MPLLPPLITCTPNAQPLYAPVSGGGGGGQVLSQTGNTVSLSGGGGSVDIATTTSVASSAQKTTAQSYDGGLLATKFDGLLFAGQTEIGQPIEPTLLTVNGSMDVVIAPMGAVTLQNLGYVLAPVGLNTVYIDPATGTLGQGANSGGWVGTATSDLNMNGYNINTASAVGIKGDTAQLQILDGAGSQKGALSYNSIDGQTHLVGTDLAISSDNVVDITATADISLFASTGNINIKANEASIGLDSHTDIGISCNNGGTITVGGVDTGTINITAPTINLNGNITSPIAMAGNSPSINYNVSSLSFPFTDMAPLFADFWLITITDTTGFYSGQQVTLSGCSDPAKDGVVNVGNVASPTQLWLNHIYTPYLGTPISGTVGAVSSNTLIGGTSDAWSIANDTIKTSGGTMNFKPRDSVNPVSASLSQSGGLVLGDGVSEGGGSVRLFNNLIGPMLNISENPSYPGGGFMLIETLLPSRDITLRAKNSTGSGYAFMKVDGNPADSQATISADTILMPSLASATTSNVLYWNSGTGAVTQGANALPSGLTQVNTLTWLPTGDTFWIAGITVPGLTGTSKISATLQLAPGYTGADRATCAYCWLIASAPSTDSLEFILAGDPSGGSDAVQISWAVVG